MLHRFQTLGLFGWIFLALLAAMIGLTAVMVALRARAQWTPGERKAAVALIVLAAGMPVVGLLGSVVSLVGAFDVVAEVNPADKATILAAAISEAMNSTLFGLLFSIPPLAIGIVGLMSSSGRAKKATAP